MGRSLLVVISAALLLCGVGAWKTLTQGQDSLQRSVLQLRAGSIASQKASYERWLVLAEEARSRAALYEELIEKTQLEQGLLVHRSFNGRAASECDSLLFSSLRYVALGKLGWEDRAAAAWRAIEEKTFENGRWIRHPNCRRKSTSRDMIVGLMTALTQNPAHRESHIRNLLAIIERTSGSIDDGPFYVSRLSPGLGELLKALAKREGLAMKQLPDSIRMGFSTLEFDTWIAVPGYTSHLNALTLWSELELSDEDPGLRFRTLTQLFDGILNPILPSELSEQRRVWAAQSLFAVDPQNLFFEWLNLKAAGALTFSSRARLLEKLLAMPQFPRDRLPTNCDRKADYLWQRASVEYGPSKNCHETFHGADFLWMTALLVENTPSTSFAQESH